MGCFSSSSAKSMSTLSPHQEYYFNTPVLRDFVGPGIGQQQPVYGGQRVAGESPLQQQAYGMAAGLPNAARMMQGLGMGMLGTAGRPLNIGSALSPVLDAASMFWNRDVMPSVMENFAGMGTADSGGAIKGLTRAGEQYGTAMAGQMALPALSAALQGRGQQISAAGMLPQLSNMGLSAIGALSGLGGEQRGQEQEQLMAAQQLWAEQQPWNNPYIQLGGQLMGQQMTPIQQGEGLGRSVLGGLATGAGAIGGSMLASSLMTPAAATAAVPAGAAALGAGSTALASMAPLAALFPL